jgi:hypothetical protein
MHNVNRWTSPQVLESAVEWILQDLGKNPL